MKQGNSILNLTVMAAVTLAAGQLVTLDGKVASEETGAHGVTLTDANPGDLVAVTVLGTAVVTTSSELKAGQALKVGENGTLVPATGEDKVVAIATEEAAEGQQVMVLLKG